MFSALRAMIARDVRTLFTGADCAGFLIGAYNWLMMDYMMEICRQVRSMIVINQAGGQVNGT